MGLTRRPAPLTRPLPPVPAPPSRQCDVDAAAPKDQLVDAVHRHFRAQPVVDESGILLAFCAALRRRSSSGSGCDA
jgi:hypothetical protein